MWTEVDIANTEKRHELVLTGQVINERLDKDGLDASIFTLESLNYLNISESKLTQVPDTIGNLVNLQTLVLHTNRLNKINENVSKLSKLKILDLSRNDLEEIPESFANLVNIVTFNVSHNYLKSFPELSKNVKLTVLDLSHNRLTCFPKVCHEELTNLFELKLCGNEIGEIPASISHLSALKVFDIGSNKITNVPGEISDCTKLKDVNFKENPISDKRLLKLINQCHVKQVLDYIRQHCAKSGGDKAPSGGKKSKKNQKERNKSEADEEEREYKYTITVHKALEDDIQVNIEPSVKTVREFILCCIVKDIKFTEESFKKFIQLQTKLHESICDRRNAATIATHDLNKLPRGNLLYTTKTPQDLTIKPLNRTNTMTGAELFSKLQTEANNARKEKKRSNYSGLHKYLYLIEGKPRYPCLLNSSADVISFPPITNSDISKITVDTTSIFIEVTSSTSNDTCKKVMDTLLREMVGLFDNDINVVQVKAMINENGENKLKSLYPAKTDLNYPESVNVKVVRL